MKKVEKGQWGIINELGQHQLLAGQFLRGSLENLS